MGFGSSLKGSDGHLANSRRVSVNDPVFLC